MSNNTALQFTNAAGETLMWMRPTSVGEFPDIIEIAIPDDDFGMSETVLSFDIEEAITMQNWLVDVIEQNQLPF
jgi:hypothetical protein